MTASSPRIEATRRAAIVRAALQERIWRRTDRMFGYLMIAQWISGIAIAVIRTPFTWDGAARSIHPHVYAAIFLGGLISSLPLALISLRPGSALTRYVVAIAQMMWSALLIHLTGGRIETHFHVFGSLAFIAFYRDWRLLVPAVAVVVLDHFIRGLLWPESVYGVANPESWRFVEHAFWVLFETVFLFAACRQGVRELQAVADRQVDIEELSRTLEEKRALLASQSDVSLEGALVVSPEGRVLFANRRFGEIWGIAGPALDSGSDADLFGPAVERLVVDPAAFLARVKHLRDHPDEEAEDEIHFRDGRTLERYTAAVKSAAGDHIGRAWYFRDISARVRAEAEMRALNGELEQRVAERTVALSSSNAELEHRIIELRETRDQLAQAERLASIGRLAAGVGHEINNPLTYIMSNLEEIANVSKTTPYVHQLAGESLEGAERVRRIVADLKMMARAGDQELVPLELHTVIEQVIRMAATQIRHRARIVRNYGDLPPVLGDAHRLGQVFLNLIINAAQALTRDREGGHEIRIATATDAHGRVVVDVIDTGDGIAADSVPRLFDAFYTTKPVGIGTGLGLSICHGIVVAHGGSIEVESTVGEGSRFRVRLPAVAREASPVRSRVAPPAPTARRRVLVVDDEPLVLKAVHRALRKSHEVELVTDAREALALLAVGSFDAILCDLMMPEMTGMEFHDQVARSFPGLERRIIFVTGGAFTEEAQQFLGQSANPSLEKPLDFDRMTFTIAAVADGGRRVRRASGADID